MAIFKKINESDFTLYESTVHNRKNLFATSSGIQTVRFVSGSISSSYWDSLHLHFYLSGSSVISSSYPGDSDRFSSPYYLLIQPSNNIPNLTKFKTSGSLISIAQENFGESIKRGSVKLTDTQYGSDIVLLDDGNGNLYSPDTTISHSVSALSSSDNYVGNIFYDLGLITITETGSYSHTPSTARFTIKNAVSHSNHFFISSSNLTTSVKFQITSASIDGTVPTDTDTIKYIASGSTLDTTALNTVSKINDTFEGFISASVISEGTCSITNDRSPNNPLLRIANLPPITGSEGITDYQGFSGGTTYIGYNDITSGSFYNIEYDSTQTIYTREYTIVIEPREFNNTMNTTARGLLSSSGAPEAQFHNLSPHLHPNLTSSGWNPYFTTIHLYGSNLDLNKTTFIESKTGFETAEPLIIGSLPRPIQIRKDMKMIFKIRVDI
tara:strand:- start:43 stop:1359 length:1317 start_codon:yes stop_codon:yes gene_type:complete